MTYIYNPTEGGGSGTDKFLSSLGFNTGTGLLTATMNDSATRTVDLDGRYLEEVLEDPTPQLGGDLDLNSSDITGTGDINITGSGTLTGDLTVDTNTLYVDSTNNQVGIGTTTLAEALTVNGNVEADNFIGGLRGEVQFKAKAGEAISKGDPLYISGFDVSGNTPIVGIADANDTNKMPAFGLAESTVSLNASVNVVTFGTLSGIDTSSFSLGDILYISDTGTLTATKPYGESSKVQNIGKVQRVHASVGSIKVGGAGRTNDVPNLNDGNVFIGNASNTWEARALTLDDISETATNKHFTASDNTKLDGIESGAEVNVNADWNAVSGDAQILNKPTTITSAEQTKLGHISVTQAVDLDTMESDITTNNAKVTNATHTGDVTGATALTIADEAVTNAKIAHVATGTVKGRITAGTGDVEDLTISTTLKTALSLSKSDVGLSNVDNTSDANKPVSTATQTALDAKKDTFTENTAFNKNFGTTAGTVAQGNDSRITDSFQKSTDTLDNIISGTTNVHFTTTDESKLNGIASGAQVNVNADWNAVSGDSQILNKPSDVTDLFSHNVTELSDVTSAGSGSIITSAERTKLTGIQTGAIDAKNSFTQNNSQYIATDTIKARDSDGLSLQDDGGNGIIVKDGGYVGVNTTTPTDNFDTQGNIVATSTSGQGTYLGLMKGTGSLPGYPTDNYPTVKTDNAVLYFSTNGQYSGYHSKSYGWATPSDETLKENIQPITNALPKVMNLEGVYYEWISDENSGRQIGLIAQNVESQFPELVTSADLKTKGVSYGHVVSVLIPAIQELKKQKDTEIAAIKADYQAKIDALTNVNTTINNITVSNLKAGVLNTDLNSVSASHDTLASAKAIKDYIDERVQYALDNATQYFG